MTTFAEIISNVEKKNDLQRQVLAQSIQPFFAAMQAQANYKEQKKRADAEMAERNAKYYNDQQELSKTGVPTPNMSVNVQDQYWQKQYSEKTRKDGLRNQIQQLGMEDQYNLFMKNNPNADIDTAWSVVSKFVDAETIDKSAKTLGTEGYKMYQTILAKTKDPATALADTKNAMAEKEAQAKYQQDLALIYARKDGDGGTPEPKPATPTQVANTTTDLEKARFELRQYEKSGYTEGNGDKALNVKINGSSAKYSNGWSEKGGMWYDQNGKAVKPNKNGEYDEKVSPIIKSMVALRNKAQAYNDKLRFNIKQAKTKQNIVAPVEGSPTTTNNSTLDDLLGDY